jgi:hypothetical protein
MKKNVISNSSPTAVSRIKCNHLHLHIYTCNLLTFFLYSISNNKKKRTWKQQRVDGNVTTNSITSHFNGYYFSRFSYLAMKLSVYTASSKFKRKWNKDKVEWLNDVDWILGWWAIDWGWGMREIDRRRIFFIFLFAFGSLSFNLSLSSLRNLRNFLFFRFLDCLLPNKLVFF